MPELPQMQALSERIDDAIAGARFSSYKIFGFSGLKTAQPSPDSLVGRPLGSATSRGKYLILEFETARILLHLSQAGRLDVESPPKATKPKGVVTRFEFDNDTALLLREFGTERKAGWWVIAKGELGPLENLGPEANSDEFAHFLRTSTDGRRIHTLLRDQKTVAGIGRGYSDDSLHHAKLSPYASLKSMSAEDRERLITSINAVLDDAIDKERTRKGGLSEAKLGEHFTVHNKAGKPCPACGTTLQRVSFESYEIVYCPQCQTGGKVLADRRLSKLLK